MAITVYKKTLLTGGTSPALDSIDGAGLLDGDYAIVTVSNIDYAYILDDDLGGAESSPLIITPDTNPGNKRWVLQTPALAALTTAGDTPYASAAGVIARLAKGAANTKLFMNAGATAPEWAVGIKLGSFTRDLTAVAGDVAYTAVGFKPYLLDFMVSFGQSHSIGWDDGTNSFCTQVAGLVASPIEYPSIGTRSIFITDNYGTTYQRAYVKTMDADGFTLTWDKAGSPTGTATIYYKALR